MFFLPNTSQDFSNSEYWKEFYRNLSDKPFDWYVKLEAIVQLIDSSGLTLCVGMGISDECQTLKNVGCDVVGVDISTAAIEQAKKLNGDGIKYYCLDFLNDDLSKAPFEMHSFDLVFDKGFLDTITSDTKKGISNTTKYLRNAIMVLKPSKKIYIITLGQSTVIRTLVHSVCTLPISNIQIKEIQKTNTTQSIKPILLILQISDKQGISEYLQFPNEKRKVSKY